MPVQVWLSVLTNIMKGNKLVMKKNINSITIEQLDSVNVSLANRVRTMGSKLRTNDDIQTSYWVNVYMTNGKMYLSADNGFDISEDVEVGTNDVDQIKMFFVRSGP